MERLPLTTVTMKILAFLYAERITGQEMTQEIHAHGLVCHLKKKMFLKVCWQVVLRHTDHFLVFANITFKSQGWVILRKACAIIPKWQYAKASANRWRRLQLGFQKKGVWIPKASLASLPGNINSTVNNWIWPSTYQTLGYLLLTWAVQPYLPRAPDKKEGWFTQQNLPQREAAPR